MRGLCVCLYAVSRYLCTYLSIFVQQIFMYSGPDTMVDAGTQNPGARLQLTSRQASEDEVKGRNPGHGHEAPRSRYPRGGQGRGAEPGARNWGAEILVPVTPCTNSVALGSSSLEPQSPQLGREKQHSCPACFPGLQLGSNGMML